MPEQIVLDQQTFKALAAGTRVQLLKLLHERKHMQSELAAVLGLAVPTVKEHLDALEGAGLVLMVDEGRKWKYYELTRKGRVLLEPEEDRNRVLVMLGLFLLSFVGGLVAMMMGALPITEQQSLALAAESVSMQTDSLERSAQVGSEPQARTSAMESANTLSPVQTPLTSDASSRNPWFVAYSALVVALAVLLVIAYVSFLRRRRLRRNLFVQSFK